MKTGLILQGRADIALLNQPQGAELNSEFFVDCPLIQANLSRILLINLANHDIPLKNN